MILVLKLTLHASFQVGVFLEGGNRNTIHDGCSSMFLPGITGYLLRKRSDPSCMSRRSRNVSALTTAQHRTGVLILTHFCVNPYVLCQNSKRRKGCDMIPVFLQYVCGTCVFSSPVLHPGKQTVAFLTRDHHERERFPTPIAWKRFYGQT